MLLCTFNHFVSYNSRGSKCTTLTLDSLYNRWKWSLFALTVSLLKSWMFILWCVSRYVLWVTSFSPSGPLFTKQFDETQVKISNCLPLTCKHWGYHIVPDAEQWPHGEYRPSSRAPCRRQASGGPGGRWKSPCGWQARFHPRPPLWPFPTQHGDFHPGQRSGNLAAAHGPQTGPTHLGSAALCQDFGDLKETGPAGERQTGRFFLPDLFLPLVRGEHLEPCIFP